MEAVGLLGIRERERLEEVRGGACSLLAHCAPSPASLIHSLFLSFYLPPVGPLADCPGCSQGSFPGAGGEALLEPIRDQGEPCTIHEWVHRESPGVCP